MNKANLLRVAEAIENHKIKDLGFNMLGYVEHTYIVENDLSGHKCGTTACIAGYAFALARGCKDAETLYEQEAEQNTPKIASQFLALDGNQENRLFYKYMFGDEPISPTMAVKTLRYAARHGVVDWEAANA